MCMGDLSISPYPQGERKGTDSELKTKGSQVVS